MKSLDLVCDIRVCLESLSAEKNAIRISGLTHFDIQAETPLYDNGLTAITMTHFLTGCTANFV